jgi:hypothetical protein
MNKSISGQLECDDRVLSRAEWEAFDYTLLGEGQVEVANNSYADDEVWDHTYIVEVEDGECIRCSCPYADYHDGLCKHQVSIILRKPVLEAATESEEKRLDTSAEFSPNTDTSDPTTETVTGAELIKPDGGVPATDAEPETCLNGQEGCPGPDGEGLECFACYEEE